MTTFKEACNHHYEYCWIYDLELCVHCEAPKVIDQVTADIYQNGVGLLSLTSDGSIIRLNPQDVFVAV